MWEMSCFRKVWHKEHDDGSHEIVEVLGHDGCGYWVGHGRFKVDEYDEGDRKWASEAFGLHLMPRTNSWWLAEALFECNMADFDDLWDFDGEAEALTFAEGLLEE